jgi:hypothetical protein
MTLTAVTICEDCGLEVPEGRECPNCNISFEEICDRGRIAINDMDRGRWQIGDDALLVAKKYGEDAIGQYAREIKASKKRVVEHRTVCAFYEKSARADFLESAPNVVYTHFRTAMRMKDVSKAYWFLEHAARKDWTTDYADLVMSRYLGKRKKKDDDDSTLLTVSVQSVKSFDRRSGELVLRMSFHEFNIIDAFVKYCREQKPNMQLTVVEK